jgi:hypothetical protein
MAIVIERTITVNNDKSILDSPLYLYVGDGDITYLFTIKEKKKVAAFGELGSSNSLLNEIDGYGEVRIYKPDETLAFTTRAEIVDDKLQAIFSSEHIDQLTEAGTHQLQIHLYDDDDSVKNRFTIPPIDLYVLFPVGIDTTAVGDAMADYAMIRVVDDPIDAFLEDGSYNKREWAVGDKITSGQLNKIEDAIYQINDNKNGYITGDELEAKGYLVTVPDEYITEGELDAKGYLTEHQSLDNYVTNTSLNSKGYITNAQLDNMDFISSMTIIRIEVVDALPETEEDGVLYIVKVGD